MSLGCISLSLGLGAENRWPSSRVSVYITGEARKWTKKIIFVLCLDHGAHRAASTGGFIHLRHIETYNPFAG